MRGSVDERAARDGFAVGTFSPHDAILLLEPVQQRLRRELDVCVETSAERALAHL